MFLGKNYWLVCPNLSDVPLSAALREAVAAFGLAIELSLAYELSTKILISNNQRLIMEL